MACVCEVCGSVGPAHLALEGSRLLAALVKNSGGDKGEGVLCEISYIRTYIHTGIGY